MRRRSSGHWNFCGIARRGVAVAELLVVVVLAGVVLGGAMTLVEPAPTSSSVAVVPLTDQKRYCEIPLGDEFVCVAELTRISRSGSPSEPYCIGRLRIAKTHPETPGPFLLEVLSFEQTGRTVPAQCRIWSLMSLDDVQKLVLQFQEDSKTSWVGPRIFEFRPVPHVISTQSLEDTFWDFIPSALRETGRLVQTSEVGLEQLPGLLDFPLPQVAAAIRRASEEGRWEPGDIHATLCASEKLDFWLSDANAQTLARFLLLRLLESLPHEPMVKES